MRVSRMRTCRRIIAATGKAPGRDPREEGGREDGRDLLLELLAVRLLKLLDLRFELAMQQLKLGGQLLTFGSEGALVRDELIDHLELPLDMRFILLPLKCKLRRQVLSMLLLLSRGRHIPRELAAHSALSRQACEHASAANTDSRLLKTDGTCYTHLHLQACE